MNKFGRRISVLALSVVLMGPVVACQGSDKTDITSMTDLGLATPTVKGETITRYQPPAIGSTFTAARSYGNSNKKTVETVVEHNTEYNGVKAFRTTTGELTSYYSYDGGPLLAVIRRDGEIVEVYFSRGDYIKFPVKPGDSWEYMWTLNNPDLNSVISNGATLTAEKWETIDTFAGTFRTLKINAKNNEDAGRWSIWFAPAIGKVVKYEGLETLLSREQTVVTKFTPKK